MRASWLTIPSGIRVCAADPQRNVVAISGDFDFQFLIEVSRRRAVSSFRYIHVRWLTTLILPDSPVAAHLTWDYCVQLAFENINPAK